MVLFDMMKKGIGGAILVYGILCIRESFNSNQITLGCILFGVSHLLLAAFFLLLEWGPPLGDIPGPFRFPVLGNLHLLDEHLSHCLHQLQKKYPDLMSLKLGDQEVIVVNNDDAVGELFGKYEEGSASRPNFWRVWKVLFPAHDVALSPAGIDEKGVDLGQEWKKKRAIFAKGMHPKMIAKHDEKFLQTEIRSLISGFSDAADNETPIDISFHFRHFSLNIIMLIAFSSRIPTEVPDEYFELKERLARFTSVKSKKNSSEQFVSSLLQILHILGLPNLPDFIPFLRPIPLPPPLSYENVIQPHIEVLDDVLMHLIQQHREAFDRDNLRDICDMIIDACGPSNFTDADIRSICADLILGGTDTSSTTGLWAVMLLAKNPEVLKKLQAELDEVCGDSFPTAEDEPRLPYLSAVILESQRLKPVAPLLLPRFTTKEIRVLGKYIPKDTMIYINYWSMCHSENYWKDPEVFRPERFLEEEVKIKGGQGHTKFVPFGGGRRFCAGFNLAVREVFLLVGTFVYSYDFKFTEGDLEEEFGLTLQPKPFKLLLKKRQEPAIFGSNLVPPKVSIDAREKKVSISTPSPDVFNQKSPANSFEFARLRGSRGRSSSGLSHSLLMAAQSSLGGSSGQNEVTGVIKENKNIFGDGADPNRSTHHIEIEFSIAAHVKYEVGDHFSITPENDPSRVQRMIDCCQLDSELIISLHPVKSRSLSMNKKRTSKKKILVVWSGNTGQCEEYAETLVSEARVKADCEDVICCTLDEMIGQFPVYDASLVLIVCSTYNGFPPDNGNGFSEWIKSMDSGDTPDIRREEPLEGLQFALFGCGNSNWAETFQHFPQSVTKFMTSIGYSQKIPAGHGDAADDSMDGSFQTWKGDLWSAVTGVKQVADLFVPPFRVQVGPDCDRITYPLGQLLSMYFDLGYPLSKSKGVSRLFKLLAMKGDRADFYKSLLQEEEKMNEYVKRSGMTILDVLEDANAPMDVTQLLPILPSMKKRTYSISSSPSVHRNTIHLTVGLESVPNPDGSTRLGVASHYLSHLRLGSLLVGTVSGQSVPRGFRMPPSDVPMIVVGPGTGFAPFRGFLWQREQQRREGKKVGPALLFFGCRNPTEHIYKEEMDQFESAGWLTQHIAYSRISKEKRYVQNDIIDTAPKIWDLFNKKNVRVFVCGDGAMMSPGVKKAFMSVLESQASFDEVKAKQYLDVMVAKLRYCEDVWA